jgi:hypothetical protein
LGFIVTSQNTKAHWDSSIKGSAGQTIGSGGANVIKMRSATSNYYAKGNYNVGSG